jgi:dihydrofolate reductase
VGRVRGALTISLDGFGAGPGTSDEHPLGVRGERLHEWVGDPDPVNTAAGEATFAGAGAVVLGRTMLDVGLKVWGADTFELMPVFVPTHRAGDPVVVAGGSTFTLVTPHDGSDALVAAVTAAREAAGDRDVVILGGPATLGQALAAGLVDELRLQVAHTLLGEGVRCFDTQDPALAEFRRVSEAHAPGVTHVTLVRD